jgi:lysophospholipase L1-like esterase
MTGKRTAGLLGLAALSIILSATAAEVLYRAYRNHLYHEQVARFSEDGWVLMPDDPREFRLPSSHSGRTPLANDPSQSVPYRTNADGFRGREIGRKQAGVPRIAVIGDSYTFGWGVPDGEAYPERTEVLLHESGRDVEVLNLGIPGYNTEQEWLLLIETMPRYGPDVVVLGYSMNDAEPQANVPPLPANTYRHARSWLWEDAKELIVQRYPSQRTWLPQNKLTPSTKYVLGFRPQSPKWRASRAALSGIAAICDAAGVPLVVLILPDFTRRFDDAYPDTVIHEAVSGWGRDLGVRTLDLLPRFRGLDHRTYMIKGDGHPNERAHEAIAEALRTELLPLLAAPTSP